MRPTWEDFRLGDFAEFVAGRLASFARAVTAALDATAGGPQLVTAATRNSLASAAFAAETARIAVVALLEPDDDPRCFAALAPFFLQNSTGLPADADTSPLFGRVFLQLFPRLYPALRRIVCACSHPARLEAWGVRPESTGGTATDVLPAADRTGDHTRLFGAPMRAASFFLKQMAIVVPLAQRIGDDPDLVDAWASSALLLPALAALPGDAGHRAEEEAARDLGPALAGISAVLACNFRPFRTAFGVARTEGPAGIPTVVIRSRDEDLPAVIRLAAVAGAIACTVSPTGPYDAFPCVERMAGFTNRLMSQLRGTFREEHGKRPRENSAFIRVPDACDGCGRDVEEGGKLRKCSRCKVAHFCSVECQVAAWKRKEGGHRADCFANARSDAGDQPQGD